uniref:FBA_2 domain-containing protein n=1 Tax=Globodera pallida TaxID=36090 RepID=A0A183CAB9_GLOPA
MSDNESDEEQQQQMEKIFICADVWYGVFAFLGPFELGLKMALISDRLDVLVDVHFKSRKWSFDSLRICRANDGNGAEIVVKHSGERLPISQGPIPGQVIGFKRIEISYVDQTVIKFLKHILFDSSGTTVDIGTGEYESRSWEIIRKKIWPLLNDNICRLLSYFSTQFDGLRKISPAIPCNCPNLRSIHSMALFPAFPADDNVNASSGRALAKWLLTPRGDCLPKMLQCDFDSAKLEGLKMSFREASKPVNYIIRLSHPPSNVSFALKNNLTREQLTLRRLNNKLLLVRCPIGREEDKWTKWEKEAIEWEWTHQWNRIAINFNDRDIGDGMA